MESIVKTEKHSTFVLNIDNHTMSKVHSDYKKTVQKSHTKTETKNKVKRIFAQRTDSQVGTIIMAKGKMDMERKIANLGKDNKDWLIQFTNESNAHPTPHVMFQFLFEKEQLGNKVIEDVEKHVSSCQRCKSFVANISNNKVTKKLVLSTPNAFDI